MPSPKPDHPVTILGAGLVGICTALSLLERGVSVRLIDRGAPGQETSMGNAGVISPWSVVPQSLPGTWKSIPALMFGAGRPLSIHPRSLGAMIPWGLGFLRQGREDRVRRTSEAMSLLCGPSVDLYRKHLDGTGHDDLVRDSVYVHAFRDGSRASLTSLDYAIRSEKGATLDLIGADELAALEPALSRDFRAAVLIHGQARAVSPGRIGEVLAGKARSLGADIVRDEVRRLVPSEEGWRICGDAREYAADKVIVALGVWSLGLLKPLGLKLPLMAERGYHVECPDPGIALNNSVMDVDAKVVASSMEGGLRVAGQAEFAPPDAPPDRRRRAQLLRIAQAAFPGLDARDARFWMGRRPSFPDSLPVLEETRRHPGLYLNFGHSHYGLMMAPKSGELMARIVTGEHPNVDLSPYSSGRFGATAT